MRFCPWYSLAEAAAHAPAAPGIYQIRVRDGLLDYPRGKSAMVSYGVANDVREALARLARERDAEAYLCRHGEEMTAAEREDPARVIRELEVRFEQRFGSPPTWPEGARA